MIVELKSNLFQNQNNSQDLFLLLSVFFNENRYQCFCEISEIIETTIFKDLPKITKDVVVEHYNQCITESSKKDYTVSNQSSDAVFNLLEAKRFFNQPLVLLLENDLYDGYFVDSILNAFEIEGKKILEYKNKGWVDYGNGGGCGNFINTIKSKLGTYKQLPKDNSRYLRCFVLIDSDKNYPDEPIKPEKQKIIEFLKEKKISFHILEKREIENYLPDDRISTINGNDEYIKAYISLSQLQKDFFDIEKGFKDKNRTQLNGKVAELYSNISDYDYNIFRKNILTMNKFKAEFPKLFKGVSKEQFLEKTKHQTNPKELEYIIEKITELL